MKNYKIKTNFGVEAIVQLTEEDAKRYGVEDNVVESAKKAPAPENKKADAPLNKAAVTPSNKEDVTPATTETVEAESASDAPADNDQATATAATDNDQVTATATTETEEPKEAPKGRSPRTKPVK